MQSRRMLTSLAALFVLAVTAASCTGDGEDGSGGGSGGGGGDAAATSEDGVLAGVCPDPVVIQTDWNPEAEHGGTYQLVGPDYTIDDETKRVTGPLMAGGEPTGVGVEVRIGGQAVGFQPVQALMYQDPDITLGYVAMDSAVSTSVEQPVVAVMNRLEINPQMIMWDPQANPEFNTLVDIGQSDTTVIYSENATYMDYLIGAGILRESQVDSSYDGSPARFVSSGGTVAQQGFATDEPFTYENEIAEYGRPVDYQLIHDTGYPVYLPFSVRADALEELTPCLEQLVPILQQAQVDYVQNPEPVNGLIVELVEAYQTGWEYSAERAAFSAEEQITLGIVGNGPDDTLGDFETDRVQEILDIVLPIFSGQGVEVAEDLTPEDLATNDLIDESIGFSPE